MKKVTGAGRLRLDAQRADGSVFPAEFSITASESEEGEIFIAFIRDLSAQVASEQELLQARDEAQEGERAKGRLLAVMSHEMRTPLNRLLGTMELLEDTSLTATQREYLRIMRASGALLLRHVGDVLDVSRIDAGQMPLAHQPFALGVLLRSTVEGLNGVAQARGNTLELRLPEDLPATVLGDEVRLQQVLLNLLSNALKFTKGGHVDLTVTACGPESYEFRITDTGIGISQVDLDRVFQDFATLDASYARATEGTGLGLGIVQRLTRAMGGQVGAQSRPGEGSSFWIRLPLPNVAEYLEQGPSAEVAPLSPMGLCVLLVEDNSVNRMVARQMLEMDGHQVEEAHDGQEGLERAQERRFDGILMDISMPRLDGVAATRAIRESEGPCRNAPIIAVTAHALPADIAVFREAGMDDVLIKPLTRAELRRVMATVLAEEPEEDECEKLPSFLDEAPLLGEDILESLMEQLGEDRLMEFLCEFVRQGDAAMEDLDFQQDPKSVLHTIHKLSGSAAVFGAHRLRRQLGVIERAL
ncbi:MAG TPA: ATP-binding protein, partial [Rubellimicrobium sp.]|nr:ATP-binding protein [Rubellimicrobium sp.]